MLNYFEPTTLKLLDGRKAFIHSHKIVVNHMTFSKMGLFDSSMIRICMHEGTIYLVLKGKKFCRPPSDS